MQTRTQPLAPASVLLLSVAVTLGVLAVFLPYELSTYAVMILGPAHVILAARYLTGRIAGALPPNVLVVIGATIAVMMVVRIIAIMAPHLGHSAEMFASMAVIGFALWVGLRGRLRLIALIPLALAFIVLIADMPWYFHVFTHAHNIVPLIFLWDYARGSSAAKRTAFVVVTLVWMLGIPALILSGATDPLLPRVAPESVSNMVDPGALIATAMPPGAPAELGVRFLAIFAFMQAMHYVLWMVFFQTFGRRDAARSPFFRGVLPWVCAALVCGAIWAAYALGYLEGRAVYSVFGAINVYLEQPIAVWLVLTALPATATTPLVTRLRGSRR